MSNLKDNIEYIIEQVEKNHNDIKKELFASKIIIGEFHEDGFLCIKGLTKKYGVRSIHHIYCSNIPSQYCYKEEHMSKSLLHLILSDDYTQKEMGIILFKDRIKNQRQ